MPSETCLASHELTKHSCMRTNRYFILDGSQIQLSSDIITDLIRITHAFMLNSPHCKTRPTLPCRPECLCFRSFPWGRERRTGETPSCEDMRLWDFSRSPQGSPRIHRLASGNGRSCEFDPITWLSRRRLSNTEMRHVHPPATRLFQNARHCQDRDKKANP